MGAVLSGLRCHFCNAKSGHNIATRQFQCQGCEAWNYLDGYGHIVDTPISAVTASAPEVVGREKSFFKTYEWKPLAENLAHQKDSAFCRTCTQNQHFYNEALSNYLPDESDRRYRQFVKELPRFKKDLEKRYPLICTACAARAQAKINRADYYALTENANVRCAETRARRGRAPRGSRESWDKKAMRTILTTLGCIMMLGLYTQIAYHVYGVFTILFGSTPTEFAFDPSPVACAKHTLNRQVDSSCYNLFGSIIPQTLILAVCLLWYNPAIKDYFHPTYRFEAIQGQANYFRMQLIILTLRVMAWWTLSDLTTINETNRDQSLATHGFVILFLSSMQWVAASNIKAQRWNLRGHCMPKPEEKDVLGVGAGPATQQLIPQASKDDPYRYLRRDFGLKDPNDLITQPRQPKVEWKDVPQLVLKKFTPTKARDPVQAPTPEYSDDEFDEDAMDCVYDNDLVSASRHYHKAQPPRLEPTHTYIRNPNKPPLATDSLQSALDDVRAKMQLEEEFARAEAAAKLHYAPTHSLHPNRQQPTFALPPKRPFTAPLERPDFIARPFQGKLPPMPMSMGKRLRNPPIQPVHEKPVHPSQQPGYFAKMAEGLQPRQFPEKGTNAFVRKSEWILPQDVQSLPGGLEERFGAKFSLNDAEPMGESRRGGFLAGLFG